MQRSEVELSRCHPYFRDGWKGLAALVIAVCFICSAGLVLGQDTSTNAPSDPVLSLLLEKGMITEDEAAKVQAQVDSQRTNMDASFAAANSKWKISPGIK